MPLSEAQQQIADCEKRWRVVVAGRRFGKTHLAIREICKEARIPNREVWYVAPSYRQAKNIVWRKLKKRLQELRWVSKINESELSLVLKNESIISLKGAENFDSLRGSGLDLIVLDEFADIHPEAWYEVLRPTLSDKMGSALFIGTPKGLNWAYELWQMEQEDPENWKSFQFTTIQGGQVPEWEIAQARRDLDERTYRQEYEATFETFSGRIYYGFERRENVKMWEEPIPQVLYMGMDFNIDPISVVIAARIGDDLHVIDEIRIYGSNTNEAVEEIKFRYPKSKIWIYPDPAGRQRKTSAGGQTDLTILQNAGFVVKAPHSHTLVRDRINAVNSRLCSSDGQRHLFVDPRCKHTIEGLERHIYKEGSNQPEKDSGYDHMMDALGYMVDYLFPIRRDKVEHQGPTHWAHRTGVQG